MSRQQTRVAPLQCRRSHQLAARRQITDIALQIPNVRWRRGTRSERIFSNLSRLQPRGSIQVADRTTERKHMNRRVGILVVLLLALAGCSRTASPPAAQESTAPAASSAAAQNPAGEGGNFPDPCTLLSDADVTRLTGRDITQVDKDGA